MAPWRNWSGNVRCAPRQLARPRDEDELKALLSRGGKVRPAGSGHSFFPLVESDDLIVELGGLAGVVSAEPDTGRVRVGAGTVLRELTAALHDRGLALPNQGDIDRQTVAGATSTGTHGTGATLGCLTTAVCGLRLVTAGAEVIHCGVDRDRELFELARLSLGLFGVITELELACVPVYTLEETVEVLPTAAALDRLQSLAGTVRHVEAFIFPADGVALLKRLEVVPPRPGGVTRVSPGLLDDLFLLVTAQVAGSRAGRAVRKGILQVAAPQTRHGPAHLIFPTERRARFEEMEYALPRAAAFTCLERILHLMARDFPGVPVPVELRLVARDDIPMSPFPEDAATIAIHHRPRGAWAALFAATEPILLAAGGRPHWGKRHTVDRRTLEALYPRLGDFIAMRRRLDPQGRFLSPALAPLFEH